MQQGQVFELEKRAVDGRAVWAYRYHALLSALATVRRRVSVHHAVRAALLAREGASRPDR
jgi:hypothetical protein